MTSDGVSIGRPAIAGDVVVAGAFGDDILPATRAQPTFSARATARVRTSNWPSWTASDAAAGDYFGISVAIAGGTIVVGASRDDDGGWNSGSVYVFKPDDDGARRPGGQADGRRCHGG